MITLRPDSDIPAVTEKIQLTFYLLHSIIIIYTFLYTTNTLTVLRYFNDIYR